MVWVRLIPSVLREAVEKGVQRIEQEMRVSTRGDKGARAWRWGLWAFWTGLLAALLGRVNGMLLAAIGIGLMLWARCSFERSTASPRVSLAGEREELTHERPTRPMSGAEPPMIRIE